MTPQTLIVIPARYGSTRLAAKPLADIHGKPMIQWVYERAKKTQGVFQTVVATDDDRIATVVKDFGGKVVMTSPQILSGTDRVAAVAEEIPADIYVNVQGDEPMIDPLAIEKAIALVSSGRYPMGTIMTPLREVSELENPSVVKVLADRDGRAIYFSRFPIPYSRGRASLGPAQMICRRHIGLYVYRKDIIRQWKDLPASEIEKGEVLEQLRALEQGVPIGIAEVESLSVGVDTAEDLDKVRSLLV